MGRSTRRRSHLGTDSRCLSRRYGSVFQKSIIEDNFNDSSDTTTAPLTTRSTVEDLLLLLQQWHAAGTVWAQPRVETYAHVIQTLVQQSQSDLHSSENEDWQLRRERVLRALQQLQEEYTNSNSTQKDPRDVYFLVRAYGQVLEFLSSSHAHSIEKGMSFDLFQQLRDHICDQDLRAVAAATTPLLRPLLPKGTLDRIYYDHVDDTLETSLERAYRSTIKSITTSQLQQQQQHTEGSNTGAKDIKKLIDQLEELAGNWSKLPYVEHYKIAIRAWANSVIPAQYERTINTEAEEPCLELLNRMEKRHLGANQKNVIWEPYERVLYVLDQAGKGEEAQELLAHTMSLSNEGLLPSIGESSSVVSMRQCWNHALMAHLRNERSDRVLHLWDKMQASKIQPDASTYFAVLRAWSTSSRPDAARRAHSIWKNMVDSPCKDSGRHNDGMLVRPNATHYSSVIVAWSRSKDRNAAQQAYSVLERLEKEYDDTGHPSLRPTPANYTAVITAWGRSHDRDATSRALRMFETMEARATSDARVKPDIVAYGALMNALSRTRSVDTAKKAEALLNELDFLAKQAGQEDMKPNKVCYNSVIMAWGRSGAKDAPQRAQDVFDRLQQAYEESNGDESLRPDSFNYASLIGVWANAKHTTEAGDRAEDILNMMVEKSHQGSGTPAPNTITYTNVILAHWRSHAPDAAQKAEAVLGRMEQCYAEGNMEAKPDAVAFTCVIQAWARSTECNKAQRAWQLAQRMCELYIGGNLDVRPNVITFTGVLNACAYTRGSADDRNEAVRIALMAMTELQDKYDTPSHITFRTLLLVFGNQILDKKERTRLASVVFERCCKEGQLHPSIIDTLRKFTPLLYKKLPGNGQGGIELPAEWSNNVGTRSRE